MRRFFLGVILSSFIFNLNAQQNLRTYIFGNSLIQHERQAEPTPSDESSVPHWLQELMELGGHDYAVSGQYGFLPQHQNVPPVANWSFDNVPGAWDSDNESFGAADFNSIMITPGNFIQGQRPDANYSNHNFSPIGATNTIFDWCKEQEDGLKFYIYESWPDMPQFLSGAFPPNRDEWKNYNEYLNGGYNDWFVEYHDAVAAKHPDVCVSMIPVGPVISRLLQQSPFSNIPVSSLYEDDAPHGQPTIYFLAAMVTYMAMLEERAPNGYEPPPAFIHPLISDNYFIVNRVIWDELQNYLDDNGNSRVFCSQRPISSTKSLNQTKFAIFPNPTSNVLNIKSIINNYKSVVYDVFGKEVLTSKNESKIDLTGLSNGMYFIEVRDLDNQSSSTFKFLKVN